MQCFKCEEEAVAFEENLGDGPAIKGYCDKHLQERAPEYEITCPNCQIQICVN